MQPLWKAVERILRNLKTGLHHDPDIPFLGTYPENPISYQIDRCTSIFIVDLFIIARNEAA